MRKRRGERIHVKRQRLSHARSTVVGVEILGFVRRHSPSEVHLAVVELYEISRAGDQAGANAGIVARHFILRYSAGNSREPTMNSEDPVKFEALETSGLSLRHRYQAGIRLRTSEYFH
jgi:hypothetical protein